MEIVNSIMVQLPYHWENVSSIHWIPELVWTWKS